MEQVDIIVTADHVVTMDESLGVIRDGALATREGMIVAVGPREEINSSYTAHDEFGGTYRAVMPGLINTHTHAAMSLMRGLADDLALKTWLEEHIWPVENTFLGEEFVRDGVRLACLEMLKGGTTAFCDMYFFDDVAGAVATEMGMRAVLCAGVMDIPTATTSGADDCLRNAEALIERFRDDDLVIPAVAAHTPYTCGPDTLRKVAELCRRSGVLINIHLSETEWEVEELKRRHGDTPVRFLDGLGFLGEDVLAAHCVWLDEGEISIMAERGVRVSHCMESNLKLASGFAPLTSMLNAGILVSIGTDGAASNNDLDMFGEMKTVSLVHKALAKDPTAAGCETVLTMATVNGAEALGLPGRLSPGNPADLVVINTDAAHLTPTYNICSHLVYAAKSSDVETVMINGRVVVDKGKLMTADENEILEKAVSWGDKLSGHAR
jgi:5-methylthioadenosine/S-adenosylhomocysteine deaminase